MRYNRMNKVTLIHLDLWNVAGVAKHRPLKEGKKPIPGELDKNSCSYSRVMCQVQVKVFFSLALFLVTQIQLCEYAHDG